MLTNKVIQDFKNNTEQQNTKGAQILNRSLERKFMMQQLQIKAAICYNQVLCRGLQTVSPGCTCSLHLRHFLSPSLHSAPSYAFKRLRHLEHLKWNYVKWRSRFRNIRWHPHSHRATSIIRYQRRIRAYNCRVSRATLSQYRRSYSSERSLNMCD